MSRYNKMMTEILDSIFEGYTIDGSGKLAVKNESACKKAQETLHNLVLEKSRDLWDQLEAAEDSLAGVAEEIRFEEMNTDPSSMSNTIAQAGTDEDAAAVDAPPADMGAEGAPALESAQSVSELLSADELNFDDIFENMDHLDGHHNVDVPKGPNLPFDEMEGDVVEAEPTGPSGPPAGSPTRGGMGYNPYDSGVSSRVVAGEEDPENDEFDDLEVGMGDEPEMGDNGLEPDLGGELDGEPGMEPGMDDMNGDMDNGMDDGMDDGGFDFDLDLGGELGDPDLDGEFGDELDEPEVEGMGMGDKSYRMESKGDDDDDKDDDKDDDGDDDDKPAFLKKKDD